MSATCCQASKPEDKNKPGYKRMLWLVLAINAGMFFVELLMGFAALLANALTFGLLWAYRSGDSNMRSAWLCSRNNVIGNCAVLLAAAGVLGTGRGWPDVIVAIVMAALAIQSAWVVVRTASQELAGAHA